MEPTDKEHKIANALVDEYAIGKLRTADLAHLIADALARHRVEVQQAQRKADAAICGTFTLAHGSKQCAAAILAAGRDS